MVASLIVYKFVLFVIVFVVLVMDLSIMIDGMVDRQTDWFMDLTDGLAD